MDLDFGPFFGVYVAFLIGDCIFVLVSPLVFNLISGLIIKIRSRY